MRLLFVIMFQCVSLWIGLLYANPMSQTDVDGHGPESYCGIPRPREVFMRFRLMFGILAATSALAALGTLTAPAAHAFTMENGDGTGTAPKFDLEEQMRQFRNGNNSSSPAGKNQFSTPFGNGTFEMSVRPSNSFNSPGSGWNSNTGPTRQDYDRMTAPPGAQHFFGQ